MNVRKRIIAYAMCYVMALAMLPVSVVGADVGAGGDVGDTECNCENPNWESEVVFLCGYGDTDETWEKINDADNEAMRAWLENSDRRCKVSVTCQNEGCGGNEIFGPVEVELIEQGSADAQCESDGIQICSTKVIINEIETSFTGSVRIPPKGHTEVVDPAEEATCEKEGRTQGSHCSVCNTVIVEQKTIQKKEHTEVVDPAEEATCEKEGRTQGSHCSVCNKVIQNQEIVPPTGHSYEPIWGDWIEKEGSYTVTVAFMCSKCDDKVEEQNAEITAITSQDPTCTETGKMEYIASVQKGEKTYQKPDPKIEEIPATGHNIEKVIWSEWIKEGDSYAITAASPCNNCDNTIEFEREDIKIDEAVTKKPTCTTNGTKKYTASVEFNGKIYSNKIIQDENISSTGHSITTHMQPPTDTEEGILTYNCDVCKYVQERFVLPRKTMEIKLGQTATVISDASKCTFALVNAENYQNYLTLDSGTGEIRTDTKKLKNLKKIDKSADIQVKTAGMTYTVKASIQIPAPAVKIKTKKVGDRYRFTFKYNVKKLGAGKIKVVCNLKGLKKDVFQRYLSSPKSNKDSYVNLYLGKNKKVTFTITAYYGKKGKIASQKTEKTFVKIKQKLKEAE